MQLPQRIRKKVGVVFFFLVVSEHAKSFTFTSSNKFSRPFSSSMNSIFICHHYNIYESSGIAQFRSNFLKDFSTKWNQFEDSGVVNNVFFSLCSRRHISIEYDVPTHFVFFCNWFFNSTEIQHLVGFGWNWLNPLL